MSEAPTQTPQPLSETERVALKEKALASIRDWVEAEYAAGVSPYALLAQMQAGLQEALTP